MNHDPIEHENLRRAVASVAGMTSDLASGLPEVNAASAENAGVRLDYLRVIEKAIDVCRSQAPLLRAFADHVHGLIEQVRADHREGFHDVLDPRGEIVFGLQHGINELAGMVERIEGGVKYFDDRETPLPPHASEALDEFRATVQLGREIIDSLSDLREAVVARDQAPVQLMLTAEQFEHLKEGVEHPRAPEAGFAEGVQKFRKMLTEGRSLFD